MIPGGGCVVGRWGLPCFHCCCNLLYSAVICCTLLPCFHCCCNLLYSASSLHDQQCLRVNEEGELTGSDLAYLYPDLKTAIVGTFEKVQSK